MSATLRSSSSLARLELPLLGVALLGRAGAVDDGVERVLDDLLGELARRVVGARRAAVERLGDVQRAGEEDERVAAQVVAQQRVVRRDALEQRVVVAARGAQPRARARRSSSAASSLADRAPRSGRSPWRAARRACRRPPPPSPRSRPSASSGSCLPPSAERGVGDADRGVVEQALVDVADLLDVERAVGQQHARAALVERLQRVEQVQHRAVVDRQRVRRASSRQLVSGGAAFEERVAVGVEQAAAVGGQAQRVVLDAAVHGAEQREHAVPGGGRALERVLAVAVGALLQLRAQRARGERLGVERVVDRQQPALLGDEQEDEAHHHGRRAAVDLGVFEVSQQLAVAVAVLAVERGDRAARRRGGPGRRAGRRPPAACRRSPAAAARGPPRRGG